MRRSVEFFTLRRIRFSAANEKKKKNLDGPRATRSTFKKKKRRGSGDENEENCQSLYVDLNFISCDGHLPLYSIKLMVKALYICAA